MIGKNKQNTVIVELEPALYGKYTKYANENGYQVGGLAKKLIRDFFENKQVF